MLRKVIIALIPLCLFLILWLGQLVYIEILTSRHGGEFEGLYTQTKMVVGMDSLKVMNYSNDTAKIYYFSSRRAGITINFARQNGDWELESWNTVWSTTGSAGNFMWPYWYHSIEGRVVFSVFAIPATIIYIFVFVMVIKKRKAKN